MKKLLIAATAALGFAAASVPASAGGSFSFSGYVSAPVYGHSYSTPRYGYVAPFYSFGYSSVPSYSYGKDYYNPRRAHRKARRAARRAYRRSLRRNFGHGFSRY